MISGIKIYNGNGTLKQEISKEKAKQLYNDNNRDAWDLSPTERKRWNSLITEDPTPYISSGNGNRNGIKPWIKRNHKWNKQYKLKCVICEKEIIRANSQAKTCSNECKNARYRIMRKERRS